VQIVLALILSPEGFPLAYEVLAGNTSDKTTLGDFLQLPTADYMSTDYNTHPLLDSFHIAPDHW
jgi:transposase